jgi:hypothetical protein
MVVFGKSSTTNRNHDKASKSCRDLQRGKGNGKGITVAEICEEEREMAREKLLQRFPKRTERGLSRFCKPLQRGHRERKSYIDSAQTYKSLQKGQRGGYVHSAKTYKSLQRRQRGRLH